MANLAGAIGHKSIGVKIALLGAESTGKSDLARLLERHFEAQGESVQHIREYLRTWCDERQRTPRIDEQLGIATEQIRQINAAVTCDYLIADTTPMMVATYSDLLFDDTSLYDLALKYQSSFDITLLMGLDIPWVADGIQRDGPHMREPVDTKIRAVLARGGINYQVVYGSGDARLQNALRCITSASTSTSAAEDLELENKPVRFKNWVCERCSDPDCEHRLFQDLLNKS
jgi:nicotinamide riboside kinase